MASKKKSQTRHHARKPASKSAARTSHEIQVHSVPSAVPLRTQTAAALQNYFAHLDGDHPRHLYDMVLREVEEPLLRAVLAYVDGNQSRAAEVLGLNRGTLRKKLREHGLAAS